MEYAVAFFKKVVNAKLEHQTISLDWYREEFGNPQKYKPEDIAIHFGLNKKTITNMHRKAPREVVINAANEHFESLCELIENLIETGNEIDLTLTIKLNGVSVDLSMNESLIVINTLAVKRAALRGGAWASVGKKAEKLIMISLCKIFEVASNNYGEKETFKEVATKAKKGSAKTTKVKREIDFYFFEQLNQYRCEVKLMGAGNSESADGVVARNSDVFIADTLSIQNRQQLDDLEVLWVELRIRNGYKRFAQVLKNLNIPYHDFLGNLHDLEIKLDEILDELLK